MRLQVESTTHWSTSGRERMRRPSSWSLWDGTAKRSRISTGAVR